MAVVQVGHIDMAVVDSSYMDYMNKVVDIAAAVAAAVAAAAVVSYLAFLSACFYILR